MLLRLDRAPQSDTERLLVNTFRAFDHLRDLLDEPFSRELFTHMRDLLLDGVDPEGLGSEPPLQGILARTEDQDAERQRRFAGRQMDLIAAYLNRESSDPDDLPVLQGQVMADAFRFYRPLGNVSSQVGRLSARLFALKNGLPVLGLLPISRAKVDWETGLINPPLVSLDSRMHVELNQRSPRDVTPHQTLAAQLTLITLRDLESHIEAWERRDEEMREILRRDPALNHRQRSVLARALRDPEAEFRIRYHKTNHSIHYTTARRDLLELQEKGYLLMEQQGKAFVFLPGPGLDELQAARSGRDDSSRHFARAPRERIATPASESRMPATARGERRSPRNAQAATATSSGTIAEITPACDALVKPCRTLRAGSRGTARAGSARRATSSRRGGSRDVARTGRRAEAEACPGTCG